MTVQQPWWAMTPAALYAARIRMEQEGLCSAPGADPEDWFPLGVTNPRSTATRQAAQGRAERQCQDAEGRPCPVLDTCLLVALNDGSSHGIWAGRIPMDLAAIRAAGTTDLETDGRLTGAA